MGPDADAEVPLHPRVPADDQAAARQARRGTGEPSGAGDPFGIDPGRGEQVRDRGAAPGRGRA